MSGLVVLNVSCLCAAYWRMLTCTMMHYLKLCACTCAHACTFACACLCTYACTCVRMYAQHMLISLTTKMSSVLLHVPHRRRSPQKKYVPEACAETNCQGSCCWEETKQPGCAACCSSALKGCILSPLGCTFL